MKKIHVASPFDSSKEARIISEINTLDIITGYKHSYNIDVSGCFKNISTIHICECPVTSLKFYYPLNLDGDANFYKQLSLNDWYYSKDRWEHDEIIKYFFDNQVVLEIGSGDGAFFQKLASQRKIKYVGLELNELALEKAKQNGIELLNETLESHSKNNIEKYDVVCSFQVLEHISDINSIMLDSIKVLKKNQTLIIAVPNNDVGFMKNNMHESRILNMPPHHVNLFTEESLKQLGFLYNLKLKKIIKEPLQRKHFDVYLFNKIASFSSNTSLIIRLIWKLKIHILLRQFVKLFRNRITGHTIIVIFEKN